MKSTLKTILIFLTINFSFGQNLVKIGDNVPKYNFVKVLNSPNSELDISEFKDKPIILVFWGTWCGPCVPEMVNLGKLQEKFADKIQIIGVSNDSEDKLKTFLEKRPSKVWYASDPSQNLWNILGINTAGFSAMIDKNHKIRSISATHLIDSTAIQNLIDSKQVNLEENRGNKKLSENENPFKLDSNTIYSFVVQQALKGISPMMKRPNQGVFAKRRITMINLVPYVILRDAYDIATSKRVVYSSKEDSIKSNQNPVCIDFIVSESDKPNLNSLLRNELNEHLSVKGKLSKKIINCLVLRPILGKEILLKKSVNKDNKYSSSGVEFKGEGVLMKSFIHYIENELSFPIFDETGLIEYYDIDFSKNNIEELKSTRDSLAKLGLELVKDKREMDVLIISTQ